MEYANENEGFFYQSPQNERVRQLLARNGLQLSTPLKISNSTISIPQVKEDVKKKIPTNPETSARSVSTMISSRYGSAAMDYLNQFIKDMNGAKSSPGAVVAFVEVILFK